MIVTCAIIEKEDKILATQRSESMHLPLKWEFPGGKILHNETEIDCIIREIKEELGILIIPIKRLIPVVHKYEKEITLVPYISTYMSGNIELMEHKAYLWLPKSELISLDWAAADLPIVYQYLNITL